LRENTERPITIELGTNQLVGTNPDKIKQAAFSILESSSKTDAKIPPLWDGQAAERICSALYEQ
jgi:UDP-N-acetylglucosamine 2-epimerase (non-hydrolysing)